MCVEDNFGSVGFAKFKQIDYINVVVLKRWNYIICPTLQCFAYIWSHLRQKQPPAPLCVHIRGRSTKARFSVSVLCAVFVAPRFYMLFPFYLTFFSINSERKKNKEARCRATDLHTLAPLCKDNKPGSPVDAFSERQSLKKNRRRCPLHRGGRSARRGRTVRGLVRGGGALWSDADGPRHRAGRSATWCRS
jgi:hypothetical protein